MKEGEREPPKRPPYFAAGVATVLLGLFYLYVWQVVGPHLVYFRQDPIFLTTLSFLKGFLDQPGGPSKYVSLFLSQFCYFPWAGAIVITVSTGLICLAARPLLTKMAGRCVQATTYCLPAVLLLMAYNQYGYDLAVSVSVLIGLSFACLHARMASRGAVVSLAAFAVISAVVYYLAGSAYVLCGVLCGIFELLRERRIALGVLYLVSGMALPLAYSLYSYDTTLGQAYSIFLLFRSGIPPSFEALLHRAEVFQFSLLASFPLLAVWSALWRQRERAYLATKPRLVRVWAAVVGRSAANRPTPTGAQAPATTWRPLWPGLLVATAALAAIASFPGDIKAVLETEYYGRLGAWREVLTRARRIPPELYNVYIMNDVNRALYHTNRLAYDMFTYPQSTGRDSVLLSFALPPGIGPRLSRVSSTAFELGLINEAEHWASEALQINGPRPDLLKRLVEINVLKGLPEAARTFLGALGKNLLYRGWAEESLRKLDTDPAMARDAELQQVRARMVNTDYTTGATGQTILGEAIVERLEQVLESNRHDKMAFEFLMAHYLWSKRLDKVAANIHRLKDFGYPDVPRHYEEAIIIYALSDPTVRVNLAGRQISPGTMARRKRLADILDRYRDDRESVLSAMRKDLDKSYFLYYSDGCSVAACKGKLGPSTAAVTGATR